MTPEEFAERWGFDPSRYILQAVAAGSYDVVDGDPESIAFLKELLFEQDNEEE